MKYFSFRKIKMISFTKIKSDSFSFTKSIFKIFTKIKFTLIKLNPLVNIKLISKKKNNLLYIWSGLFKNYFSLTKSIFKMKILLIYKIKLI